MKVMVNIIKFDKSMLGSDVTVLALSSAEQRGFAENKLYNGKLLDKADWMVGCHVFSCDKGLLGVGYECEIVSVNS